MLIIDRMADLAALSKRKIKLMVTSLRERPPATPAREALQWQNGPYRNADFQRGWEAIIREWSVRWGDRVFGGWFDGGYWPDQMYRRSSR